MTGMGIPAVLLVYSVLKGLVSDGDCSEPVGSRLAVSDDYYAGVEGIEPPIAVLETAAGPSALPW